MHTGDPLPDRWPLDADLEAVASRWKIDPVRDLATSMIRLARSRRQRRTTFTCRAGAFVVAAVCDHRNAARPEMLRLVL